MLQDKVKDLALYVVVNSENQFYRARGQRIYGKTWVDNINSARIYTRLSQARAQVSFFAMNFTDYPAPTILKLEISGYEVLVETERLERVKKRRQTQRERNEVRNRKRKLEIAQLDLEASQRRLEQMNAAEAERLARLNGE